MNAEKMLGAALDAHMEAAEKLRALAEPFGAMARDVTERLRAGGRLLIFGNGGSAADAQHLATELVARFEIADRPAIGAVALTCDTSALTAICNDWCVERMFARQVEALGRPGDVALGISTSGNSGNVTEALLTARGIGMLRIGFTGRDGGRMAALLDHEMRVDSAVTARIQEMHILLGHALCGCIEQSLFDASPA